VEKMKISFSFQSGQVDEIKMPRGGSRSCVEKKKRSEDEELERVFLQVELSQSPSKRQRGGQRNQLWSSSSLPCRISQAVEEQKSEENDVSLSSLVREIDGSLQAKFERDYLMRKYGQNVDDENPDSIINTRKKMYCVEAIRDKRIRRSKHGRETIEFLIKWKGYPESENTWEGETTLGAEYFKDCEEWWIDMEIQSENSSVSHVLPKHLRLSDKVNEAAIESVTREAREIIMRTAIDEEGLCHAPLVCVVCDRFISRMETPRFVSLNRLLEHKERLSAKSFEEFHRVSLPLELAMQYTINGAEGLLLSKRARNNGSMLLCCESCKDSLTQKCINSAPPKFSIANFGPIGVVPERILGEGDYSDLLAALVVPSQSLFFCLCLLWRQAEISQRSLHLFSEQCCPCRVSSAQL
jgi:hypothetical protein